MEDNSAAVILATLMVEETNSSIKYEIKANEVVLGRNKSLCDIHLPYNNLSKQHCKILIDNTEHFIMDMDSRNKTHRNTHCLHPNTYYELTNGIQLTLADVKCQYFIGEITDKQNGCNVSIKQHSDDGDSGGIEETPVVNTEVLLQTEANNDDNNSGISTRSPSPSDITNIVMVTDKPIVSSNCVEDPLDDTDDPTCCSPLLLARELSFIEPNCKPDKPVIDDNDQTLAYDTSGVEEMDEGVASDGKSLNKGVESDDQTLSFNITGVYCSDGKTEEGKEKVLMADPTVAYELEESVNENDDNNMIEQTVGYEERSEDKNDITIDLKIHTPIEESISEGMVDPTVPYRDVEIDKRNDKGSKDIDDDVAGSENDINVNESKDISNKGSEDVNGNGPDNIGDNGPENIGSEGTIDNGPDNIGSECINENGPEIIGSECINENGPEIIGSECINENGPEIIGSEGTNNAEPTVPYVINDNEETDSETTIHEHKITNVRYSTRKGNSTKSIKGSTPAGRGRSRRGKVPVSEELPMEVTDSAKNEEDDNKETEPSLPVRVNRKRRAKCRLSDDDDNDNTVEEKVTTAKTKGVVASRGRKGRKRMKTEEKQDVTKLKNEEKLSHDMSDESPDIPTLNRTTPTNKSHPDTAANSDTIAEELNEAVTEIDPKQTPNDLESIPNNPESIPNDTESIPNDPESIPNDTESIPNDPESIPNDTESIPNDPESIPNDTESTQNSIKTNDSIKESQTKGRRGRKRKAATPLNKERKAATPLDKEDGVITNEVTNGRKRITRKSTANQVILQDVCNDDEIISNKQIKLEISKVSKRKLNKGDKNDQSSITNTPSTTKEDVPKVMFTGGLDEEGADTVQKLGGIMVDSVFQCTHLITDKVRRTVKFLCCLSRGCIIVNSSWLDKCRDVGSFVSAEPFVVKDKTNERLHKFVLKDSIAKARSVQLLKGWSLFVSDNVKPCPKDMADIIESSGGEILAECPVVANDSQLIISCEQDLDSISDSVANGVTVCSNEVILTGVLRQQFQTNLHRITKKGSGKQRRR